MTFTLATYGTTDNYSWVTEGWSPRDYTISQREEANEWAKTIAHTAIEFGHDMPDDISEIDPEDLEWEIKQIADHIRDWFDANADELKPATTESVEAPVATRKIRRGDRVRVAAHTANRSVWVGTSEKVIEYQEHEKTGIVTAIFDDSYDGEADGITYEIELETGGYMQFAAKFVSLA